MGPDRYNRNSSSHNRHYVVCIPFHDNWFQILEVHQDGCQISFGFLGDFQYLLHFCLRQLLQLCIYRWRCRWIQIHFPCASEQPFNQMFWLSELDFRKSCYICIRGAIVLLSVGSVHYCPNKSKMQSFRDVWCKYVHLRHGLKSILSLHLCLHSKRFVLIIHNSLILI